MNVKKIVIETDEGEILHAEGEDARLIWKHYEDCAVFCVIHDLTYNGPYLKRIKGPFKYIFFGKITALRKTKGLSQGQLAALCGLRQPNLSRIENGLTFPRPTTLKRIAEALGVHPKELISETADRPEHPRTEVSGRTDAGSVADSQPQQLP